MYTKTKVVFSSEEIALAKKGLEIISNAATFLKVDVVSDSVFNIDSWLDEVSEIDYDMFTNVVETLTGKEPAKYLAMFDCVVCDEPHIEYYFGTKDEVEKAAMKHSFDVKELVEGEFRLYKEAE